MFDMMWKFIAVLVFLSSDCSLVNATLKQQVTVGVGETAFLPCTTTLKAWVDWQYHVSPFESPSLVYSNGKMYYEGLNAVSRRFNVTHPTQEDFTLTIRNAELGDTGLYTCTEDGGTSTRHTVSLLVTVDPVPVPGASNLVVAVIVLAILLAILLIAIAVAVLLFFHWKKRRASLQSGSATKNDSSALQQTELSGSAAKEREHQPLIELQRKQPVNEAQNDELDHDQSQVEPSVEVVEPPPTPPKVEAVDLGPPSFTHIVSTESGNEVRGVCILGARLYVARSPQSTVDIYDAKTLKKLVEKLDLIEAYPGCMALCPTDKYLYITYYKNMNIQKISVDGKQGKQWRTKSPPDGISVAPSTHVVVALREAHQLVEFTSDGQELSSIDLQQRSPRHPIPFGNDCYLVCFGVINTTPCEVHLIDKSGRSVEKVTTNTQHPLHLAVDSRGYVYVADFSVNHVTMLDKGLKYLGEVIAAHETKVDVPFRLCFNEKCDRLYVGEYGGQRRVMAFDIN